MQLPEDFITLMRQQYGDEQAERLFEGLSAEPCVSIRLNPKKMTILSEEKDMSSFSPVPWCQGAYYLDERPSFTCDPLFHAGAYYVQEASSMYLAEALNRHFFCHRNKGDAQHKEDAQHKGDAQHDEKGQHDEGVKCDVALDLCAAPGGKSTLLRSLLPEDCILISNEPIAKRTQILAENMTKWGYPNTFVTQNYPNEFGAFSNTFDLIVTDVPCSGEGMFRKDEGAIRDWSLENVDLCWHRQRDILASIWPCLKEGGTLVYSTCTFNHFEDEDNARWIATELGAELLEERHFLPGRDKGEGFYIAILRKNLQSTTDEKPECLEKPENPENIERIERLANIEKLSENVREKLRRKIRHGLRCFFDGIHAPMAKGKDMIPDHALAMSADYKEGASVEGQKCCYPECELTYDEALAYLRHEVLRIDAPKGIVLVRYKGLPLGFVKNIGNRANNLYPQEWRIRTTYTTPYCLLG